MTLMRFLGLAARYPEQVEMLSKMNLEEFIEDWVMAKRKNAAILKWGEKDPRKAFGLSKAELKTWVEHGGELDVLRLKKKHQEASVEECAAIRRAIAMGKAEEFLGWARAFGIKAGKVIRYLERLPGPLSRNAITWLDWISMAEQLGYDLGNPLIQMPGELYRKHDEADSALRALKIRRMEQQERDRMERAEKKYGFTYGDYLIRAPMNGEEIIEEGKALHHCVGGYAARHMDDVLTILFLRRKSAPYTPYVTIEMRGNSMMQIHGYNNERDGSESPAVVHREMLSAWGEWLEKGSKRDKDGNPILTKKKGNAA